MMELESVIAKLYEAAIDASQWPEALKGIVQVTQSSAANFLVASGTPQLGLEAMYTWGHDPDKQPLYSKYYFNLDPMVTISTGSPGRVMVCHDQITDRQVAKAEYYQDFYLPLDLRYLAAGAQLVDNRIISMGIHRAKRQGEFDTEVRRVMQHILPHVLSAFRIQFHTQRIQESARIFSATIDQIPHALILVEANAKVRHLNSSAERLLRKQCGVSVQNQRLVFHDASFHARIIQQIRQACRQPPVLDPAPLMLNGADGRPTLEVSLAPLSPHVTDLSREPLALLILRESIQQPSLDRIAGPIFGLTKAELRVAKALIAGTTPENFSQIHEVSINTVRTQIRSLLQKTGTTRIVEAVALLSGMVVPLSPSEVSSQNARI